MIAGQVIATGFDAIAHSLFSVLGVEVGVAALVASGVNPSAHIVALMQKTTSAISATVNAGSRPRGSALQIAVASGLASDHLPAIRDESS